MIYYIYVCVCGGGGVRAIHMESNGINQLLTWSKLQESINQNN